MIYLMMDSTVAIWLMCQQLITSGNKNHHYVMPIITQILIVINVRCCLCRPRRDWRRTCSALWTRGALSCWPRATPSAGRSPSSCSPGRTLSCRREGHTSPRCCDLYLPGGVTYVPQVLWLTSPWCGDLHSPGAVTYIPRCCDLHLPGVVTYIP